MEQIVNLINENAGVIAVMSVAIALDIVTGVIKAILAHDLKSCKFKEGLLKKCYDYILVIIAFCMDYCLKVDYISNGTIYAMIAMELYSCVENLRDYVPIPSGLEKALDLLQKKSDTPEKDTLGEGDFDTPTEEVEGSDNE